MEDRDKQIMTATFSSHYGAMLTKKRLGAGCTLRPIPRSLSASCGTCAVIEGHALDEIRESAGEYLEAVYLENKGRYEKLYEFNPSDKSC